MGRGRGGARRGQHATLLPFNLKPTKEADLPPIKTMKEALGARRQAYSMAEATTKSNPYYQRGVDAYSANCQRCVIAYEARRRGYDVVAQPTFVTDKLPSVAHKDKFANYNAYYMGAFKEAKPINIGRNANGGSVYASTARENIKNKMKEWGNGSRAILQIFWAGGGGHVVNLENINGKVVVNDAQVSQKHDLDSYVNSGDMIIGDLNIIRTDNLRFSDRVRKSVEPTNRRRDAFANVPSLPKKTFKDRVKEYEERKRKQREEDLKNPVIPLPAPKKKRGRPKKTTATTTTTPATPTVAPAETPKKATTRKKSTTKKTAPVEPVAKTTTPTKKPSLKRTTKSAVIYDELLNKKYRVWREDDRWLGVEIDPKTNKDKNDTTYALFYSRFVGKDTPEKYTILEQSEDLRYKKNA